MISTLVSTTVHRPVAVLMITIMVAVAGLGALFLLPMDFYPPLSVPELTIATTYGGLPAKEVRELITIPVEDTVSSLAGLKKISSSSLDGISIIELSFTWGTDIRQAGIQAREMADIAALELPEGASRPMVLPVNPTEKPVLYIGVFPRGTLTIPELKRLCDREIKSLLQQAPGVGSIQILGGLDEEILIEPDPYRLGMYSLAFQTLAQAVQATNTEVPAGSIEQGTTEYIVKTESMIRTPQDISGIPLFTSKDSAGAILVRDIARVSRTTADRTSFLLRNGEEGIGMLVRAQGGYSPVSLSVNVRRTIRDIQNAYGCSLSLEILSDSSYMIRESIRDLLVSGLAGICRVHRHTLLFKKPHRVVHYDRVHPPLPACRDCLFPPDRYGNQYNVDRRPRDRNRHAGGQLGRGPGESPAKSRPRVSCLGGCRNRGNRRFHHRVNHYEPCCIPSAVFFTGSDRCGIPGPGLGGFLFLAGLVHCIHIGGAGSLLPFRFTGDRRQFTKQTIPRVAPHGVPPALPCRNCRLGAARSRIVFFSLSGQGLAEHTRKQPLSRFNSLAGGNDH